MTGANFAGFYEYPLDSLYDIVFGIAEVEADGSCVITKHEAGKGFVTEDTCKCQFLYELQGNVYLNSDVKAILDGVEVRKEGDNRSVLWFVDDTASSNANIEQGESVWYQGRGATADDQASYLLPRGMAVRDRR